MTPLGALHEPARCDGVGSMLGETWEDQYRRLQRSHDLLQRVCDQYIEREEIHEEALARDIVYHFCCDAFHLRDWIKASTSLSQSIRADVSKLFDVQNNPTGASTALAACADIANASKHLQLTKRIYTPGGPAEVVKQEAGIKLPFTLPAYFTYHFTIEEAGGVKRDALDVAADAIADWDAWLTGHGVPLPS